MNIKIVQILIVLVIWCSNSHCTVDSVNDSIFADMDLMEKSLCEYSIQSANNILLDYVINYNVTEETLDTLLNFSDNYLETYVNTLNSKQIPKPVTFEESKMSLEFLYYHSMNDPENSIKEFHKLLCDFKQLYINKLNTDDSIKSIDQKLKTILNSNFPPSFLFKLYFQNLIKLEKYDIIFKDLELYKLSIILSRYSNITLSAPQIILENLNYYFMMKCYCSYKLGYSELQTYYGERVMYNFQTENTGTISELLSLMCFDMEMDISMYKIILKYYLIPESYAYGGLCHVYRSRFLRSLGCKNVIENLVQGYNKMNEYKLSDNTPYYHNFERFSMHMAFLYYEQNNPKEAMKWFKRALTDQSTFAGDWDAWLRYRDFEPGEKEALLELKDKYLKEQKK